MAIDPARAYYAGSKYLATPLDFYGTIEDMVSYNGMTNQEKMYAPKYPSIMPITKLKADYLIYVKPGEV